MHRAISQIRVQTFALAVLLGSLAFGWGTGAASGQGRCLEGHVYGAHGYFGGPPTCFGYYSTCWRPWPAECCPCPSFAEIINNPEVIAPAIPLPSQPYEEVAPKPAPVVEPGPQPKLMLPQPPDEAPESSEGARTDFKKLKPKKIVKPVQYGRQAKR